MLKERSLGARGEFSFEHDALGVHRPVIGLLAEHAVERIDQLGRQRCLIGSVLGEGGAAAASDSANDKMERTCFACMMGSFRGVKHMIPQERSGFANCAGFLNAAAQ